MFRVSKTMIRTCFFGSGLLFLSACYFESHTDTNAEKQEDLDLNRPQIYGHRSCDLDKSSRYGAENAQCAQDAEHTWFWKSECRFADCKSVDVYVHYLLSQDLGNEFDAVIEAFDNDRFIGTPVSTAIIHNFKASKSGSYDKTKLVLFPGRFYLRAYLTDSAAPTPYTYQNMELVGEKPMGVFGALSALSTVEVSGDLKYQHTNFASIYIDKLFQKNSESAKSDAFLRVLIKNEANVDPQTSRLVRVGVYDSSDFARTPVKELSMTTEALRAPTAAGFTELISNEIQVGRYFVFAYLDLNDNHYHDEDEPSDFVKMRDSTMPSSIRIEARRTETVKLTLKL